jgi:hypothetical protein
MENSLLTLNIENLYAFIKEYHPLILKADKEWSIKGYQEVKKMIKDNDDSIESNIYGMQYYVSNFNDYRMFLEINKIELLGLPMYPGFYVYYNINENNLRILGTNKIITHINNKPFIEYFKKFSLFNNGSIHNKMSLLKMSFNLFENFKNPFLRAPDTITINKKVIKLRYRQLFMNEYEKYKKILNELWDKKTKPNIYKIEKKKDILYIKLDSFLNNNFITDIEENLPVNKIIIDLRNNTGGWLNNVYDFFKIIYNFDILIKPIIKISKVVCTNPEIDDIKEKYPVKNFKIAHPKLKIIVNEFSLGVCQIFVYLAKLYIKNVEIEGDVKFNDILCGSPVKIEYRHFVLSIPTLCIKYKQKNQ